MKTYLVGGALRDKLLGLPVAERDWVVVGATPEDMLAKGFKPVGKDFPVFLHPETGEEYALARTERKTGPGYHGFTFHADPEVTLEEDLRRRDLTINAMAEAPDGQLIDPYGGERDLREGILRHVSPAFAEDPVRILRVARFAARLARWGFRVAHGTHRLMKQMVENGEVDHLVPERVWAETVKALGEPNPERYFEVLAACGALAHVFPELAPFFPEPGNSHGEGEPQRPAPLAALVRAAELTPDPRQRFAALAATLPPEAVERLGERLRLPNDYRRLALLAARHCKRIRQADRMAPGEILELLEGLDAFRRPETLDDLLPVCAAAAPGEADTRGHLQKALAAARAVNARELAAAGLKGAALGEELRRRRTQAIAAALH